MNSIIQGNEGGVEGGEMAQVFHEGGAAMVAYSCIEGLSAYSGSGNIRDEPAFVDVANGDLRLAVGSPCVNSGSTYAAGLPAEDIEGAAHIQNCRVDMGAYESSHTPGEFLDCNGNSMDDDCDVYAESSRDCNENHIPDECGPDEDTDGDGVIDECNGCPNDPHKIDPGVCGCGTPDTDSDGDSVYDWDGQCPNAPTGAPVDSHGCPIDDNNDDEGGDRVV